MRFSCSLAALFLVFSAHAPALVGAPLAIDFNIAGRSDSPASEFTSWIATESASSTFTLDDIRLSVHAHGGTLKSTWWKGGAIDGGRLVVDGITAGPGGSLELRIAGLPAGRHSIATYHNWTEPAALPSDSGILLSSPSAANTLHVQPSYRAGGDADAAVGYLTFDATEGTDCIIRLEPQAPGGSVILCGFRLDVPDPRRQASHPSPPHRDEHVDGDAGGVTLRWRAPAQAVKQLLYVGSSAELVASASEASAEFKGAFSHPSHRLETRGSSNDVFWRVDAVDAQGEVTRGEIWRFRPRRIAFPGAEGYGRFAIGGRGGKILHVTTLADSGPGSLRAAVEAEGPRTVVFDVGGLITLQSRLTVRHPYLTVAGQTAPGKGITLRGYSFGLLGAHDVVIRHVRVRPGNIAGVTLDGMGMASSDHSIIDHASISWTIDEAFSSRGARNITLQHTLISEALNVAGHKKYRAGTQHGYAASISGMIGSFHHNLLAHNSGRNWSLAGGLDAKTQHTGWLDIRNNVVYNWHNRTTDGGAAKVNYVNNFYAPGPASKVFHLLKPERNNISGFGPQDYYVSGNVMEGHVAADDTLGGIVPTESPANFMVQEPFFPAHVETQSAKAAYKRVLSDVGCTQPVLDAHDHRVIQETLERRFTFRGSKSGLSGLPDSQDDVGGWEDYPEQHRDEDWDSDADGLPNAWERIHGTNAHSPMGDVSDAHADPDGDGFTALESYLNWMAEPHYSAGPGAALVIDLARYTRGYTARPRHRIDAVKNGHAELGADGHTLTFRSDKNATGLARITFTVEDAEGDTMTRDIGIAVRMFP